MISQVRSSTSEQLIPQDNVSTSPFFAFSRGDRQTALFCFLIALFTFWWTAMPNIGLGDDGEMATAALHMGVPHPSGYPLWTILAGLFTKLLPFGNGAWKLNLFSGLCAASAVGIFTLLARSTTRWLGMKDRESTLLSIAGSLTFAWSVPVWSQATIGKGTYSLHVLLMLVLAALCYLWIRTPSWKNAFVWIVFSFALGMSNHHMTLAMAILPLLVILLLHGDLFWEYTVYSLLIGSSLYLGFAALSSIPDAMKASFRFFLTMVVALLLLVVIKKKLTEWKRGLLLVLAVFLGLLPYLYMPLASSTNPPMNWSYTSTQEGFFYAINRSQYWGTLANQLQSTFGKLMGVPPPAQPAATTPQQGESTTKAFLGFFKRFWRVLFHNISPLPLLAVFAAFLFYQRQSKEKRIWLILLTIGFFLSAFFEPIMAPNGYDNTGWDMQKPWQGLCYGFLLLLACYGTAAIFQNIAALAELKKEEKQDDSKNTLLPSRSQYFLLIVAGLVCCFAFYRGLPLSSQRGHWFGWMYGHDMLADLPPDSFVFGGTDPGRFVPTYMIFGESFETSKRDPFFDRRDLYIVTQNALADNLYNRYIRSQYSYERPSTFNWFERWLGRDHVYPKGLLILPHREEIIAIFNECMRYYQQNPSTPHPQTNPAILNTAIAQWIFLNNRDQHRFFVEESFPMPWSYPYAIPHGLCYEINHDPVPTLSPEVITQDQQFWTNYIERLKQVKGFKEDELGRHSFAKLRNTTGNIYNSRNMNAEAEFAYKQALELWPANSETVENLVNILTREGRLQEAVDLTVASLPIDPDSKPLQKIKELALSRLKASRELPIFQQELTATTKDRSLLGKAMQDYLVLGDPQKADQLIQRAMKETPNDTLLFRDMINFYATQGRFKDALRVAQELQKIQPKQWDVPYTIAKYEVILGEQQNALVNLRLATQLGGKDVFQAISREQIFQQLSALPEFQDLMSASDIRR
jgi:tetratricopeptide (TPR) repeat protein